MHHGVLIYALIFSCMNDSRVLSIKLLLALWIKSHAPSLNLYGKICQFSFDSLHSSINTRSSSISDLDLEHIHKCFYIHASLLSPVFMCVVRTPRQLLSQYEQHRAEVWLWRIRQMFVSGAVPQREATHEEADFRAQ